MSSYVSPAYVSSQILKGRNLSPGKDQVFILELLFGVGDKIFEPFEVDERQALFEVGQHAKDAIVIAPVPDGDRNVFFKIDSAGHGCLLAIFNYRLKTKVYGKKIITVAVYSAGYMPKPFMFDRAVKIEKLIGRN